MNHTVPHDLSWDLARKACDAALHSYCTRFSEYGPKVEWTDDRTANVSFRVKGLTLKGVFTLLEGAVGMDMEVPLLLRPFRTKALEVIEEEIRAWIGKAKAGAL